MKKLLILVDWFYPGYKAGGPIQSCINLCEALNKYFDIHVLTMDTDHGDTSPYPGIQANEWIYNPELNVQVFYAEKKSFSNKIIFRQIQKLQPDTIYLNHMFSPAFVVYPLWLKFRGKINSNIVICPRGALFNSALAVKPYKKKPLLALLKMAGMQKWVVFHATNHRESEAVLNYFPGSNITVANNLPHSIQYPFETVSKFPGTLNCIFISRIVPIKNLLFILKILKGVEKNTLLTVAGPIEDEAYFGECKTAISKLPPNIRVEYVGAKPPYELNRLIKQNHLFILPTKGENFGHSIFEALLAGRPVLISDQTPWHNLQQEQAGWDLPLESPESFLNVIEQLAASSQEAFDALAKSAWKYAEKFSQQNDEIEKYKKMFS